MMNYVQLSRYLYFIFDLLNIFHSAAIECGMDGLKMSLIRNLKLQLKPFRCHLKNTHFSTYVQILA